MSAFKKLIVDLPVESFGKLLGLAPEDKLDPPFILVLSGGGSLIFYGLASAIAWLTSSSLPGIFEYIPLPASLALLEGLIYIYINFTACDIVKHISASRIFGPYTVQIDGFIESRLPKLAKPFSPKIADLISQLAGCKSAEN